MFKRAAAPSAPEIPVWVKRGMGTVYRLFQVGRHSELLEICRVTSSEEDLALILAAPQLLAACKLALMASETNATIDWDDIRRVIELAEGQTVEEASHV